MFDTGQDVAEIVRAEERTVGDESVDVHEPALPSRKLLQVEIELRLDGAEPDRAGLDPAADIGQEIGGVGQRKGDAVALEIGPQACPNPPSGTSDPPELDCPRGSPGSTPWSQACSMRRPRRIAPQAKVKKHRVQDQRRSGRNTSPPPSLENSRTYLRTRSMSPKSGNRFSEKIMLAREPSQIGSRSRRNATS